MAAIKYKVELTEAERSRLNEVSQRGKASVRTVKRALSLLKADEGLGDREIADVLLVNAATVARLKRAEGETGSLRGPSSVSEFLDFPASRGSGMRGIILTLPAAWDVGGGCTLDCDD